MWRDPFSFKASTADSPATLQLPAANQFVELLNTTRLTAGTLHTLGTSATTGTDRGLLDGGRANGHVYCTTQNMTLRYYFLRADGTWDTTTDKPDAVITAGTALPFTWLFSNYGRDCCIVAIAGATPPGAVYTQISVVWDRVSGV